MNELLHVLIAHRRFQSAFNRANYLARAKIYERPIDGAVRVGHWWGLLPLGEKVSGNPQRDAAFLIFGADFRGRSEVLELLVSADEDYSDRLQADKIVDEIVDAIMREFFPGIPFIACRHNDRSHAHAHAAIVNDDGNGRCLELDGPRFNQIRRQIEVWTAGLAKSGWGRGTRIERELAALLDWELADELREKKLTISKRDKLGNAKLLIWKDQPIRLWHFEKLLGDRAKIFRHALVNASPDPGSQRNNGPESGSRGR